MIKTNLNALGKQELGRPRKRWDTRTGWGLTAQRL